MKESKSNILGRGCLSLLIFSSFISVVECKAVEGMKSIRDVISHTQRHWVGDGFHVIPVFANKAFTNDMSPFLMFDYAAPKEFSPTKKRLGVGQHPHRGFETITLAFQGEVEHADSQGNRGVIGAGDVQWMTAARGIVHEEFHSTKFAQSGGVFEMCQIWLNLPKEKKMIPPRYQGITTQDIPKAPLVLSDSCTNGEEKSSAEDGYVRVIAGHFNGHTGPADTHSPVNLWDITIAQADRPYDFHIEDGHNTVIFVRRGGVTILDKNLKFQDVAIMSYEGDKVTITAREANTQVLVLSGQPLNEPIANHGPFVMNTRAELEQAFMDYQTGRNGF